jgi:hypothetical protein
MKQKVTLTLDQELIEFLELQTSNHSEYLNTLLCEHCSKDIREFERVEGLQIEDWELEA